MIDSKLILQATGISSRGHHFSGIGDVHANHLNNILSFLKDGRFATSLNDNPSITGVICTQEISKGVRSDIEVIICDDPNWAFFMLIDALAKKRDFDESFIHPSSETEGAFVADRGVTIGKHVTLEPFAVVQPGTTIGDGAIIRAGAVLGLDTFQHQRTSRGTISPKHDGDLSIGPNVEIGANCTISKGFSYRNTHVQSCAKIDAGVYIGHGANVGQRTIVCAGSQIMGHVIVGDDAFIGPGAQISSRVSVGKKARVSIGSVVTKNVRSQQTVTGNFAIPHRDFLKNLKTSIRET